MFKKGVAIDRVVGFEDLGGGDSFNTALLARKFIAAKVMVAKEDDETLKVNFRANDKNNGRRRDKDSDEDSDSGNDYWLIIYTDIISTRDYIIYKVKMEE